MNRLTRSTLSLVGRASAAVLVAGLWSPAAAQVEVFEATIDELQAAMSSGSASSVAITQAYLDRIEAYDRGAPGLKSIVWINPDALDDAAALDREREEQGPRGPLHGIPIILKDNYDTHLGPTTAGTLALATHVAPDDAFQVARLREAGAVILAKANMHELASGITTISSLGGQTLNPYDPDRNPGGSSGGTGTAIAASFAAVGWGSDTCGSIRIPAAQNDLVGLRPTKGLSSIDGIIPLSHTQDVGGPLARTVRDLAIALDATVGYDPADPATELVRNRSLPDFVSVLDPSALEGVRVGILEAYFGSGGEDAAAANLVRTAIGRMVELGADTVTVEVPHLDSLISGSGLIGHEFRWDMMDYLAAGSNTSMETLTAIVESGLVHEALAPRMRGRLRTESRDSEEYRAAYAKRAPLREAVEAEMNRRSVDALAFPTLRREPALIGEPQRGSSCSLSANTGLPSISVPVGFTASGLPIGIEMIGRTLEDHRLVAFAYAFESGTDHRRAPWTTPRLVNGRAVRSVTVEMAPLEGPEGTVGVRSELDYVVSTGRIEGEVRLTGTAADDVIAMALQVPEQGDNWMVIARLSWDGETNADVAVELTPAQREALHSGDVRLIVLTRTRPLGARWARLRVER